MSIDLVYIDLIIKMRTLNFTSLVIKKLIEVSFCKIDGKT